MPSLDVWGKTIPVVPLARYHLGIEERIFREALFVNIGDWL